MEYKFITLLANNNTWLDWIDNHYTDNEGVAEPEHFPCYVIDECCDYNEEGEALFAPHFLYHDDVEQMLENLE